MAHYVLHTWIWNNNCSLEKYDSSSLVKLQHIKHTRHWGGVTLGISAIIINISEHRSRMIMKPCTVMTYCVLFTLPVWSLTITVMGTWYNWLKDDLIARMWHSFTQLKWYRRSFSHFSHVDVSALTAEPCKVNPSVAHRDSRAGINVTRKWQWFPKKGWESIFNMKQPGLTHTGRTPPLHAPSRLC